MTSLTRTLCLFTLLALATCVNKEIPSGPNCDEEPVLAPTTVVTDATSCNASDGTIEVTAVGGIAPFMYQLGSGTFVANPLFTSLTAGSYVMTVKDSRGCTNSATAVVNATGSTLNATIVTTPDNECFAPHDGTITVTPTGGTPPYQLKFGNGAFDTVMAFDQLEEGVYPIVVMDDTGCLLAWNCTVHHGDTGTSYENDIAPILNSACNSSSCHGAGTGSRSWTSYANVAAKANQIKLRTASGSMPPPGSPDLTPQQIQIIACWVDDGAKNN